MLHHYRVEFPCNRNVYKRRTLSSSACCQERSNTHTKRRLYFAQQHMKISSNQKSVEFPQKWIITVALSQRQSCRSLPFVGCYLEDQPSGNGMRSGIVGNGFQRAIDNQEDLSTFLRKKCHKILVYFIVIRNRVKLNFL